MDFKNSKHCELLAIVKTQNDKFIITSGKYRMSKHEFNTMEDAENYIMSRPWELIINLINIIYHYETEQTKSTNKVVEKKQK